MKTTQKAVMMWRKALWTPLVFLSSSICPQMSQRVVILRTIVRHPFQCLLASQFDDIHLWGRIIAFSTCITVIGPLCSPQSIQRPNIKLKMLSCQKWRFWWILLEQIVYSKSKEEKANSPILMEFATLYTQYPWHYCSYCHNGTKEIYKDNHNCVFTIVSTMHASKALLKFNEPWLSHDQSGGIEFSCWRSCAADHRWAGFGQASIAEAVFSDTCQVLSEDGYVNSSIFDFYKSLLQLKRRLSKK